MSQTEQHLRDNSQPTFVRYRMVLLAMLVAVLLYLDRICLSTAGQSVKADLGLEGAEFDRALSAFFWTYALFQLPAGWLGDRFGARYVLAVYVALWSLSTGFLAQVTGVTSLIVLRLLCGMFEAGAYPLAAGIVRRWIPLSARGIASSVVAVGGRLGGAVAPVVTMQLMLLWSYGSLFNLPVEAEPSPTSWRPVMWLYGGLGLIVAVLFAWRFRDQPGQHPSINQAELKLINPHLDRVEVDRSKSTDYKLPLKLMLTNRGLWLMSFVQFASNFGWAFIVTKLPEYLDEVHKSSAQAQGWLQSLPLATGIVGMLLGGLLLDALARKFGVRVSRSAMLVISRLLVGMSFFGCLSVTSATQATVLLAIIGFTTDLGISAMWAYGQDVGRRHTGVIMGWANMWGNLGAACSPILFGYIVRLYPNSLSDGWRSAFIVCGLLQITAAVAALAINAAKPLEPESE